MRSRRPVSLLLSVLVLLLAHAGLAGAAPLPRAARHGHGANHRTGRRHQPSRRRHRAVTRARSAKAPARRGTTAGRSRSSAANAKPSKPALPGPPRSSGPTTPPVKASPPASPTTTTTVPTTTPVPVATGTTGADPAALTAPAIGALSIVTPFPIGERLFSPTSVWNAPLAPDAPLDPRSAQLSAALSAEVSSEMSARTGPWINTNQWGVPVYTVGSMVPAVHVTLDTYNPNLQAQLNAVPIPTGAHASSDGDEDLVIYQPSTDTLWEMWLAHQAADGWHARWGGEMTNVSTSPGFFSGSYGASATGLSLLGGLITINELWSGQINHALAISIPNTAANTFTWPAQRGDGRTTGPTAIPEGTRFRIDPSLDLETLHLSPAGLIIARAVQRYGMIIRDTGGNFAFYAEDPTTGSGNPYGALFRGQYPNSVLAGFPWGSLQAVAAPTSG